jgi:hypothetical protein
MLRRSFVISAVEALTAGFFITILSGLFFTSGALASPAEIGYSEQRILELHNSERAARGIRPLTPDSRLQQAAREWAYKLAGEGTIYHMATLPARSLGYRAGGENIVYRAPSMTADYAHIEWMKSDLHRKNALDPAFSSAGVGVYCAAARGLYFTVAVVEFGADASVSTTVPPLEPRVAKGDGMSGRVVTCKGHTAPAPPAPLITGGAPAPASIVPARATLARKPASVPPAPKPVSVPALTEVPPPGPPPVLPPAPVSTSAEPSPAPSASLEEDAAALLEQERAQQTDAPTPAPTPPALDSTAPVSNRDQAGLATGLLFVASLTSWLMNGFVTGRRIRRRRDSSYAQRSGEKSWWPRPGWQR